MDLGLKSRIKKQDVKDQSTNGTVNTHLTPGVSGVSKISYFD